MFSRACRLLNTPHNQPFFSLLLPEDLPHTKLPCWLILSIFPLACSKSCLKKITLFSVHFFICIFLLPLHAPDPFSFCVCHLYFICCAFSLPLTIQPTTIPADRGDTHFSDPSSTSSTICCISNVSSARRWLQTKAGSRNRAGHTNKREKNMSH